MAEGTQQHPLKIYFFVWILLFVFSAFSYWVDWYGFQGYTRWGLILLFMMLKAGFICAIFMHMFWERLPIIFAILGVIFFLGQLELSTSKELIKQEISNDKLIKLK